MTVERIVEDVAQIERAGVVAYVIDNLRDVCDWLAANAHRLPDVDVFPGVTRTLMLRPCTAAQLYNSVRWLFSDGAVSDYAKVEMVLDFMRRDDLMTLNEDGYRVTWAGSSWIVEREWGNQVVVVVVDREVAR